MLGKLIKQSETGKCLVIGTIMADRLIIKQQKISVWRSVKFQFAYIQKQGYVDNGAYINYTINENKATDRRLVLRNMDYKRVTAILSGPAVTFLCDL